MSSSFEPAVEFVLKNEGALEENPSDPGGLTKYGISLRFLKTVDALTLRNYQIFDEVTQDTVRDLSIAQAKFIYQGEFWNHAPFSKIVNQAHCNYIFDMAVNMGIAPAVKCVQHAVWAVMKSCELPDDGILGDDTLSAISSCGLLIFPAMRSERAGYYRLTEVHNNLEKEFLDGWLKRAYESN